MALVGAFSVIIQLQTSRRFVSSSSARLPQYIIAKLGLTRDPLAELEQDLSLLDCPAPAPPQVNYKYF